MYISASQVNFFVAAFYDAVVDYGWALNQSIELGVDYRDGVKFVKILRDRSFEGEWHPRISRSFIILRNINA